MPREDAAGAAAPTWPLLAKARAAMIGEELAAHSWAPDIRMAFAWVGAACPQEDLEDGSEEWRGGGVGTLIFGKLRIRLTSICITTYFVVFVCKHVTHVCPRFEYVEYNCTKTLLN